MPASSLIIIDTDILIDVSREIEEAMAALQHYVPGLITAPVQSA